MLRFRLTRTTGCVLLLAAVWGLCHGHVIAEETTSPEGVRPLRVLVITGGCCHDYTAQKALIANGLRERGLFDVEVVQQGGKATDAKIEIYDHDDWADGFDVVIHDECFAGVNDRAYVDRILRPHREGLPAVVVHCAMHCYRDGRDEWFRFCGVTSRRHGAHYPHEVLNRDATHPIMQGWPAAWANPAGELYWIEKVWETAHPLASAKIRETGSEEVCVWTNQYGKGRVFGTTLGHHNETVRSAEFLDLLTRGTLWACGKLDDPRYLKQGSREPRLEPVNLAQGKPARASSEETGKNNLIPHAVDGNEATRWCAANGSAPQWLEIDLGEPKTLRGCEIVWESDQTQYRYTVETSSDGVNWRTVVDQSQEGRSKPHQFAFDAEGVRLARVTYLGSNTGGWGSIRELRLFGDEMVAVDPEQARKDAEAALLADVRVPPEFDVTLFAAPPAVQYPVFVAAAPDGTVYVSVDKNGSLDREPLRGAIYRLKDYDGDGRADEVKLFVADVDSPRGLWWDHDRLYVMHPPHLSAFIDSDGDGIADEQKILVENIAFDFKDRPADHTSNGVTLGIDGWLYLAIGDFGFMRARGADGTELQFRGGGVLRVRPDGSHLEVYSRGTRNILEVAMDPLLNGFTRDNTNDGGGWDIRLHHFTGLEHHGYPTLYMNFGDEIVQPLADYGGGSGCGALYLSEPGFPEGFGEALYTADWGRNVIYRHRLVPAGATFTPDQTEFVRATRVTDLDADARGNIYVTSWKGATFRYASEEVGYLVRVTPKKNSPGGETDSSENRTGLPDYDTVEASALVAELASSRSHRRRLEAQRALLRRGLVQEMSEQIFAVASDRSLSIENRVAALYTLKQAGADQSLFAKLSLEDEALRPLAIRALGDRHGVGTPWDQNAGDVNADPAIVAPIAIGLIDENPRSRLEAAIAIARLQLIDLAGEIAKRLDENDPVVAHTFVQALIALGSAEPCFALVDESGLEGPPRERALRVLQALHRNDVVDGLLLRLRHERDNNRRRGLITALARLHFVEGEWSGNSWGTRPDTRGPYYQPETWEGSDRIAAALKQALDAAEGEEAAFLVQELVRHRVQIDGMLERTLAMAKVDPAMLPVAVGELERAKTIPTEGAEILMHVTSLGNLPAELRSRAARVLTRVEDPQAWHVAFSTLFLLDKEIGRKPPTNDLWETIRQPRLLEKNLDSLKGLASQPQGLASRWANAALLTLADHKDASPEAKGVARKSLEEGWKSPERQRELLEAARSINHREFESRIREAMRSHDAAIAKLAGEIAKEWKLEAMPTPAGPKIGSLDVAEVMASVATPRDKQDIEYGRHLFEKLTCNNCHTVEKSEPLKGPFIPQVAKTYNREKLAEAILQPSKSLAQGFVTQLFVMSDGTQVIGFVTSEDAETITLRDKQGKESRIAVAEVDVRTRQEISMMPEGLLKESTVDDLHSLLDYLQSVAE